MKKIFYLLSFVIFLTGCGGDPMNERIDGRSEKAFQESLSSLKNELSTEEMETLTKAMLSIYTTGALSSAFTNAFTSEKNKTKTPEIWQVMDGKTPNQIITSAKEKPKEQEVKTPPIQIQLNKPFILNELEFTVLNIRIGELKSKSEFSRTPKGEHLLIRVSIKNNSEGNIFQIMEVWRDSVLTDNFKNSFETKEGVFGIENITPFDEDFRPNKIIQDTIIYPLPLDNASNFSLMLKPIIYSKSKPLKTIPTKSYQLVFDKGAIEKQ